MAGRLYVGTSGFAYKEWKPEFYPADLKDADMLRFYSTRFPSVEINNTFYRTPNERTLRGWSEQTAEAFRFTLKAPQKITHVNRLRVDTDDVLEFFLRSARSLGARLGCILFQCPPTLKHDEGLLTSFLAALPGEPFRFAMEFRHASWKTDEVRDSLAANGVAWCVADTDEEDADMARTAQPHAYLRLRKLAYDEDGLKRWAAEARAVLDDGADVYCYFKHEAEGRGLDFARALQALVG